jgi:hypothetical protein
VESFTIFFKIEIANKGCLLAGGACSGPEIGEAIDEGFYCGSNKQDNRTHMCHTDEFPPPTNAPAAWNNGDKNNSSDYQKREEPPEI